MVVYKGSKGQFRKIIESKYPEAELDDCGDKLTYRFTTGEILNWWQNKGTIQVQGKSNEVFKQAINNLFEKPLESQNSNQEIFIVYGHDQVALDQLENLLLKLDLKPFILKNQSQNSKTIIEVLEKYTTTEKASFGIVLLTPDDRGYPNTESSSEAKPRARQNVIFEMGMLIAALGRENVAILQKGVLERPSDIEGMLRLEFNTDVREISQKLIQSMKKSGISIDSDKAIDQIL